MRTLIAAVLLVLALAACGGPAASETPSMAGPPSSTPAASAAGLERMCAAFDIVQQQISPAYDDIAAAQSELDISLAGLAIMSAGSDIVDLADGVQPDQLAAELRFLGERYITEGEAVSDGDATNTAGTIYYLELLERHGQDC